MTSSSTEFRALTWHTEDGFGRDTVDKIVGTVFGLLTGPMPDVAVFPQAYKVGSENDIQPTLREIESHNYTVMAQPYNDEDGRKDRHGMIMAARSSIVLERPRIARIAGRNMLKASLGLSYGRQRVDVIGVDLDDRKEIQRLAGVAGLNGYRNQNVATVALGNVDAIERNAPGARTMRTIGSLARLLPKTHPGEPRLHWPFGPVGRFASVANRSGEMAKGYTIAVFDAIGFADADENHQSTMAYPDGNFIRPVAQLDRILYTDQLRLIKFSHRVLPDVSKHALIMADFAIETV